MVPFLPNSLCDRIAAQFGPIATDVYTSHWRDRVTNPPDSRWDSWDRSGVMAPGPVPDGIMAGLDWAADVQCVAGPRDRYE
ncbi:hypothetical protein X797_003896 [Metarhizium robertsii]|uniref:Uncharacterized protein n=1 Tax=Metarhizium robertsii TaxID=568076 RepID=A0A0A1UXY1_9HYPO|nr:hypothetical protein X797_003896 [Metarhizium robertsii]